MELRALVPVLRERWITIVVGTGLGLLISGAVTWVQSPQYASQVTLFVSVLGNGSDAASAYQSTLLSQQRVRSYKELVKGEQVMRAVVAQLKLHDRPDQLSAQTSATAVPDTSLLAVTVVDHSAHRAQRIANAVAERFIALVPEFENVEAGKQAPVRVSVVNQAALPPAPISPQPLRNLGLGLWIGLVGGTGLAAARHGMDSTLKTSKQAEELTRTPSLGTVPFDAVASKTPLVINENPYGPRSEAFRKIRTNLQYVDLDHTRKVILVTSAVAGEGKSTTACNLAITVAETGRRVLLIDADLRRPRAARYLGLPEGVGLTSVLVGSATLAMATQPWGDLLAVLASGPLPPNPSELLGSSHMRALLDHLRQEYDLVIIDGPPVLPVADAPATAAACDGTIVVVRHGKTKREQVHDMMDALRTVEAHVLGTILNLAPARDKQYYYYRDRGSEPTAAPQAPEEPAAQLVGSHGWSGAAR